MKKIKGKTVERKGKKGRPLLNIKADEVVALAKLGATNIEIAEFFGCSDDTIVNRFSKNLIQGRAARKIKLREWQWRAAEAGNVTMLIFLGKAILGQSEKSEVTVKGRMYQNKALEEMSDEELILECKKYGIPVPDKLPEKRQG